MLKKRTLSRRERVQQRLNESAGIKDTVTRRIMAYVTLIVFVSSGGGVGMLLVSIAGLLVIGGPALLLQAWRGKEEPGSLYVFGLVAVGVGSLGGSILGALVWDYFVRKTRLISEGALRRM